MDIDVIQETPAQRRRRQIRKAFVHLCLAVVICGLLVVAARALHRRVLYQAPDGEVPAIPDGATVLMLHAADGVSVNALEFLPAKATRTVVHFHGNAEVAEDNVTLARELVRRGFSVVLVEYRGYGRSRGSPTTEAGLYLDGKAVLDALAARGIGPDHVVLWGQALGAGVAAELARDGRGARLILVAPFTSTIDLAARVVPFLPLSYIMVDRFDTLAKAPQIEVPTLVVHGDIDDVVPFEQGKRVSEAIPHATFLKVPEGRHDNLYKSPSVLPALVQHAGH